MSTGAPGTPAKVKAQLHVREQLNVQTDVSGVLFTKNQFILRAELRVGLAHLRPSAFAIVDLTA